MGSESRRPTPSAGAWNGSRPSHPAGAYASKRVLADGSDSSSSQSEESLFLSNLGEGFTPNRLTQMVREYVKAADLGKTGSCHFFRHACVTRMHENGADIRMIQAMLGHAKLEATQIYTHLSIKRLQEVHAATHPAAKIGKKKDKLAEGEQ